MANDRRAPGWRSRVLGRTALLHDEGSPQASRYGSPMLCHGANRSQMHASRTVLVYNYTQLRMRDSNTEFRIYEYENLHPKFSKKKQTQKSKGKKKYGNLCLGSMSKSSTRPISLLCLIFCLEIRFDRVRCRRKSGFFFSASEDLPCFPFAFLTNFAASFE